MFRTAASYNSQVVAGVSIAKAINLYATSAYAMRAPCPKEIAEGTGKKRSDCIPHCSALFFLAGWVRIGRIIREGKVKAPGSGMLLGWIATSGALGDPHVPFEATTELAAAAALVANSIADVCKGNDAVLTMLVEDSAVIDVVLRRRWHA